MEDQSAKQIDEDNKTNNNKSDEAAFWYQPDNKHVVADN